MVVAHTPEDYPLFMEYTGTAMALIEADHTLSTVNSIFAKLAGLSKEEIEGKRKWLEFIHKDDQQRMLTRHEQRITHTGNPPTEYEFRFLDSRKTIHYTNLTVNLLGESKRSIVSLIDITEYKQQQMLLERRLSLEKIIAENSHNFINSKSRDTDTAINQVLRAIGEFAGVDRSYVFMFSEDEKTMSNTHEWCAEGVKPEIEMLQDLSVNQFSWLTSELRAGHNINIADLDELPTEAAAEKEILQAQDIKSVAIVPLTYADKLRGYLGFDSTRSQVLWSKEDFLLLRTIGHAIINAFMRSKLEHQLLQSNKMDAIGRFAGGIAHDFNNILATVQGNAQLLSYSDALSATDRELINTILRVSESGSNLTRQLLAFSRDDAPTNQTISAHPIIKKSYEMLQRLISSHITIHTKFKSSNDSIKIDPSQLEQIIMNLVINSSDAMPRGGDIIIQTENIALHSSSLINGEGIVPGEYFLLQIIDNGHGMSAEVLEKALEPFFTTKDAEKGTGLGLSNVYTIIRKNSGYMEIYSRPGNGTRIDIYLPLV